ncbi:Het-C-domain-containing protein [Trametes sanguinea]|nr:Het-C-domain-containing protein [Trametes sanguinea]
MSMNSFTTTLLVLTVILVLLPSETYAFGAGDIPDFAYLNGKAFRHGDIEDILTELAKTAGHAGGGGGGLLGSIAQSVLGAAIGGAAGAKFTKEDVKRVYFGNWLRDYSQCMDIAGLSKLSADTLVLIVSALGFLTFGFATGEFEVTADRLGVYLPVEHIDNPKGYAEKEGDARQFHPKLRPPVNPEELEIDERTGMKKYMATENCGWDTSTALIRRVFRSCIEYGRRARGREGADLWEAYRLMGTGLHTMEDLLAHSNWCELALRKMGYNDVFCHVGDNVLINSPSGETHPLVTGTFGGADFLHSLMGEATDHLSQASVVDLSKKMDDAQSDSNSFGNLSSLLKKLPIGGSGADSKMDQASSMQEKAKAYRFDPNNVAPPEVREQLWQLLTWRDSIYKDIIEKIDMIPGLSDLIDGLTNALNAVVYTILAPYLTPILKQVTDVLMEGSKAVIDTEDQYQVFDNPDASDPSHSLLSKDHFALILNEPAGKIALVVVQYSVGLLVDAWFNDNVNPDQVIDQILEAFHHPWYATGRSRIQQQMFQTMQEWVNSLENVEETMQALTKESVRAGTNKRQGSDDDMKQSDQIYGGRVSHSSGGAQYGVGNTGYGSSQPSSGYGSSGGGYGGAAAAVASAAAGYGASSGGYEDNSRRTSEGYGGASTGYGSGGYGASGGYGTSGGYGSSTTRTYGESEGRYGSSTTTYSAGYEEPKRTAYGESEEPRREHHKKHHKESEYGYEGRQQEEPSYGRRTEGYGAGDESNYGRSNQPSYGGESQYGGGYGGGRREREEEPYGSRTSYGEAATYGEEEGSRRHHGRHGHGEEGPRRDEYGGGGYRSNEYQAPPPPPPREDYGESGYGRHGGREEGYGGGEYGGGEGGYGRPAREGYGEGYAPSYNQGGYEGSGGYGRAQETSYGGGEYGGGESRGYSGGGYGGEGEYGRRQEASYGQGGETFGVEGLSLGGGEEEPRRHHGKHHHHREEDY